MLPSPPLSSASSHTLEALDDMVRDHDELERVVEETESSGLPSPVYYTEPNRVRRAIVEQARLWSAEGYPEGIRVGTERVSTEGAWCFTETERVELYLALARVVPKTVGLRPARLMQLGTASDGHARVCHLSQLAAVMTWIVTWLANHQGTEAIEVLDPRALYAGLSLGDEITSVDSWTEWVESLPIIRLTKDQIRHEWNEDEFETLWTMCHQWMHEKSCVFNVLMLETLQSDIGQLANSVRSA